MDARKNNIVVLCNQVLVQKEGLLVVVHKKLSHGLPTRFKSLCETEGVLVMVQEKSH